MAAIIAVMSFTVQAPALLF